MMLTPKRIIALKVVIHTISLGCLLWLVMAVNAGSLGGDPTPAIIHYTGMSALNTLFITLLITPLARWSKQGLLFRVRRLLGLYSFFWAILHLMAFAVLDLGLDWLLLAVEVIKRPYLTIGMVVWVILLLLAVTSIRVIQRSMGTQWQKLHNGIYLAVILAPIHYYWSVKSEIAEAIIYILIAISLLVFRWRTFKSWITKP